MDIFQKLYEIENETGGDVSGIKKLIEDGQVTIASSMPSPDPKDSVRNIELINSFMAKYPPGKADGGMLVKPSADGSRPGYARVKTSRGNIGGSDFKPLTKENVKLLKTRYADEIKNTKGGYEKWRADPKNSWKVSAVRKGKITADTYKKPRLDLDALEKIIDRTNQENKIYSIKEISKIYFDQQNIKPKPGAVGKDDLRGSKAANPEVNKLFKKILPPEEKVNRVIEQMLISDEPLPKITFKSKDANAKANWRKYIINEVGEGKGDGLKKLLKNNKFYKKNAEVLNYMFNIRNDVEGMTFKDALDYATKAKKGMPTLSGMKGNFSFSPVYRTMDFAFRNWDANKGKGLVKFFDKNGKPITWSPGLKKLDYNTVSFSKGGNQTFSVNGKYNNSISIRADGEQFFPKVFEAVKTRNALLDTKVDDPFRKGKQILFSELINKIQVKGYGWSPDKKQVLEILHGPDGVAGNPFDNLKVGTSKLNNTLSTLDSIPIKGLKNKIMNQAYGQLKGLRGERLTKSIIDQQLEIGAKVAAGQTFPISDRTQIFMDALDPEKEILGPLSQKEKTFIETKLKSPAVRLRNIETKEAIDNLFASFSANPKCRVTFGKGQKEGGRIGYATGPANLVDCADSGRKRLEKVIKTGVKLGPQEGALATQILKAGASIKDSLTLRGMFGPAAIAFLIGSEAGFVGYDMLSEGKTMREAVGDSLFNYMLGEKTKINPQEELFKRYRSLGYDDNQMFQLMETIRTTNLINRGKDIDQRAKAQAQYVQGLRNEPDQFMGPDDQMMSDTRSEMAEQKFKDIEQEAIDYNKFLEQVDRPGGMKKEDAIAQYFRSGKYAKGLELVDEADAASTVQKMQSPQAIAGGFLFPKLEEKRIQALGENLPGGGVNPASRLAIQAYEDPSSLPDNYRIIPMKPYGLKKGGRAGYNSGKLVEPVEIDFASAEDKAFSDMMKAFRYYIKSGGTKSLKDYMRMSTGAGRKGGGKEHFRGASGGIAKLAGKDNGPPPESGPNPQGLQGLLNRVKKV